jgi:hypothetical protein
MPLLIHCCREPLWCNSGTCQKDLSQPVTQTAHEAGNADLDWLIEEVQSTPCPILPQERNRTESVSNVVFLCYHKNTSGLTVYESLRETEE